MKYEVRLEYYLAAAGKQCHTRWLPFQSKHVHGAQPSQQDLNILQPELEAEVQSVAIAKGVAYPGNAAVLQGREVRTKSTK